MLSPSPDPKELKGYEGVLNIGLLLNMDKVFDDVGEKVNFSS